MRILVLWRLVALSVILSLLSIGVVSLLAYFNNRTYILTRVGARYQNIAFLKMQQIDQYMSYVNMSAYTVSTRLVLRDESTHYYINTFVNETYLNSILANAVVSIPDLTAARVLGLRVTADDTRRSVRELARVGDTNQTILASNRIFDQLGLASGFYGPYQQRGQNGQTTQILALSVPIYSRNEPLIGTQVGVLQALFESLTIENIILGNIIGTEPSSQIILVGQLNELNAIILFRPSRSPDDMNHIIPFTMDPAIRNSINGTGYIYDYDNYNQIRVTSGYASINQTLSNLKWGLVYENLQEEVFAPVAYLQNILLITFFSVLVATVFISFFCIYKALKPLQRLNRETSKNPSEMQFENSTHYRCWLGDLRFCIQDEFSVLAKNFQNLVQQLNRQYLNLEVLVSQRTSALADAEKRATLANVAKSNFLANMSHELRTPLTAILGMVDVYLIHADLKKHQDKNDPSSSSQPTAAVDNDLLETFSIIKTSGEHLLYLLNDILDIAKIESGHLELEMRPFVLGRDLVDHVKYMFQSQAQKAGLSLDVKLSPSILTGKRVLGDIHRLRQVLFNLVNNAIKFTKEGEVTILVDQMNGEADQYVIHVKDTGCGMSPEVVAKLYQPFQQADVSTTRKFGGTGLGLAVSRQLIVLMGGTIDVDSELNVGSTFHVHLKLPEVQKPTTPPSTKDSPNLNPTFSSTHLAALDSGGIDSPKQKYILLVDDNAINLKVITRMLTSCGVLENHISLARNGLEAIEVLSTVTDHSFDIVFMDLQMPLMDGYEAARQIRAKRLCKGKVIALTANAQAESIADCLTAGMHDVLTKPIQVDKLKEILFQ